MVRLSATLLVAALLQTATSMPVVDERQFIPTSLPTGSQTGFPTYIPTDVPTPTSLPPGFPTGLPTGIPTGFPTGFPGTGYPLPTGFPHHPHHPHHPRPEEGSRPIPLPEKRNLPVTPKWLRWLPFENINM